MKAIEIFQQLAAADDLGWEESNYIATERKIPPAVAALAREIGDDTILAEATIEFVRQKKRDLVIAKLVALYGRDWVDAMIAKETGVEGTTESS